MKKTFLILAAKHEGKRLLGRPCITLKGNAKIDHNVVCGVWAGIILLKIVTSGACGIR